MMHPRLALLPLLVLGLRGCALPEPSSPATREPEPDYRAIVAENIATLFARPVNLAGAQISRPREPSVVAPSNWFSCLRINAADGPRYYALFMEGRKLVFHRAAVPVDRCQEDVYEPAPRPTKR